MSEGLVWPPKKEDLERMYVVENLSAAKIAKRYGLKYASAKTAESTVLYHLKRNGVARRDRAEHIRKVTPEMVDEWVKRYQTGESLKRIADNELSPVTVLLHLRKRGVPLRNRVAAQIEAVTKYERRPFSGDPLERAYLIGFRLGDLGVVRHGRAIRVRTGTTHPAMAVLFESLFSSYGHIARYPRKSDLAEYEWSLECDLEDSFEFLLAKPTAETVKVLSDSEFLAFLAGFFDAEGSIYLHRKSSGYAAEVSITNKEYDMLELISERLAALGIVSKLYSSQQDPMRLGYYRPGEIWRLKVWRFDAVKSILKALEFRHREKVEKSKLALSFSSPLSHAANAELVHDWAALSDRIEEEKIEFISEARNTAR